MKRSFEHVRTNPRSAQETDLEKLTQMFRQETTYRNLYLATIMHTHEHLGQLIAYARTNNVLPPWSAGSGD